MARVRACLATGLLAVVVLAAGPVFAQDIVVGGERITADDIDQRAKLDQLVTNKTPTRDEVVDELRQEAHRLREMSWRGFVPSDAEVDADFGNLAARVHMTPDQMTEMLARQGIDARALKRRIRADIVWAQYVRSSRYRSSPDPALRFGPAIAPSEPFDPRWCPGCDAR